jgi:DNA-directed RNA polymerase sigma subunit (sigma70/sigma32)
MSKPIEVRAQPLTVDALFQQPDVPLREIPPDIVSFAREYNHKFRKHKQRPDLTREVEVALFQELRANKHKHQRDDIIECLINSQDAWITVLAKRKVGSGKKRKELLDMAIQAGRRGALISIEKFDLARGARFITYATYRINREITKELVENDPRLKLPAGLQPHIAGYYKACNKLFEVHEGEPTVEAIYQYMAEKGSDASLDDVKLIHRRANPFSLDKPIGDQEDSTLSAIQEQTREPPPDARLESLDETKRLHGVLNRIPAGDRLVLKLSRGIGTSGGRAYSNEEIARGLGWESSERINQVISRAMRYADMNKEARPADPDNREVYVFENLLLPLSDVGLNDRKEYKQEGLKVAGRGEDGPLFLKLVNMPQEQLEAEIQRLREQYGLVNPK